MANPERREITGWLKPGTIISDRYVIERLLGEGGMGNVYEARHIHINKHVAIKFLSRELLSDTEMAERFLQEARIAATLKHLNICEVTDFGVTEDGLAFLVMELLEGYSLAEAIKLEKRLPEEYSLRLIKQILNALEEAHSKDIIHRDLKPANIFITYIKGHGELIKLLDFGISKVVHERGSDSTGITKSGVVVGTPFYMSPEQVRGKRDIDRRADIYSCGVILYEMLTGKVPYNGKSYAEIILKIIEEPVPDPRKITPDLNDGMARLIMRCMSKDAGSRPSSASTMKEEVDKLLGQTSLGPGILLQRTSRPPAPAAAVMKTKRILMPSPAVIIVFLFIIGVLLAILLRQSMKSNGPQGAPAIQGEGKKAVIANFELRVLPEKMMNGIRPQQSPGVDEVNPTSVEAMAPQSAEVTIKLKGLPRKVKVQMGDMVFQENVLHVPKSSIKQVLKIHAAGFEPMEMAIIPDSDKSIKVELVKKSGQPEFQAPGKPPEAGQESGPEGEQTDQQKKSKLPFFRDFPTSENEEEEEKGGIIKEKMGATIETDYGE
jgi:serine/threonine protein kinase